MIPQAQFRPLIVKYLSTRPEGAKKADVIAWLGAMLADEFDEDDLRPPASRPNEPNWSNRASWERNAMVEDGLLERRSDGVWRLVT